MRKKHWFYLAFLIIGLTMSFGGTYLEKKAITKCSKSLNAVIIDKYRISKRGYFLKYKYFFKEKYYYATDPFPIGIELNRINLGSRK